MEYKKAEQTAMLVLLFDIMGFGIVGGYLSKLCVTLPHMSIACRVVRSVSLQKIDAAPYAKRAAEAHNDGLQSINCTIEKFHKFTSINSDRDGVWVQKSRHT